MGRARRQGRGVFAAFDGIRIPKSTTPSTITGRRRVAKRRTIGAGRTANVIVTCRCRGPQLGNRKFRIHAANPRGIVRCRGRATHPTPCCEWSAGLLRRLASASRMKNRSYTPGA